MTWFYEGNEFTPADVKENQVGFVYRITRKDNGRSYIGQKKFFSKKTKPPLKGRKRKRRSLVPSNWLTYWGSCDELIAEVKKFGQDKFCRQILRICDFKAEMNYFELKFQMEEDVLLHPDMYFNRYVGTRLNALQLSRLAYQVW